MNQLISKSQFKPQVLEYLRMVEKTKKPLIITHAGRKVIKIVPYAESPDEVLKSLKNSVIEYKQPTRQIGTEDWESLK